MLDKNLILERIEEERDIQKKLKETIWLCRQREPEQEAGRDLDEIPIDLESLLRMAPPNGIPLRFQKRLDQEFLKFRRLGKI